jgi:signal transduction histidine kinase
VGSAQPQAQAEAGRLDAAWIDRLWTELEVVAVALRPQASGWAVASINPQAAQLLPLPRLPAAGCNWSQALADWPPELAAAVARLEPGQRAQAGRWSLEWLTLAGQDGAEHGGRLLLLRPQATAPQAGTEGDAPGLNDHESFVYSVSHDLRAPIRVVEGFARILKEDYGRFLDRIGNDHLDRVLAAAARMNAMIDALLALSRLQSQPLARKPVDLSQLAGFIVEDLRSAAPERSATIHIEPGIVVIGDPTLLRIAMENLIGNAWKYSGLCAQTVIEFRREQHDGQPVLVLADQGAGFDMRFADRLFGVFQRLHSPKDFQGTGVGLASVKRILRRHGGDIWAESEVGKGARFYFTVPS